MIRGAGLLLFACVWGCAGAPAGTFVLRARRQVEEPPGSGRVQPVLEAVLWEAASTAVIVCDMWDTDWCREATRRMAPLAPRVDAFIRAARREGAFIIHAPSGNMAFYAGTEPRRRAQEAPPVALAEPISARRVDPSREGPFPIDDTKSICPCEPKCGLSKKKANTRQTEAIGIAPEDAISDSAQEICNLLAARGIRRILFTGVHNNLCVLVRPFGIRQLRRLGFEILLVRDLTIAMYDPRERPQVTLERATELVNEHIERYWCPSVLSTDLLSVPR